MMNVIYGGCASLLEALKTPVLLPLSKIDENARNKAQEIRLYAGRPAMLICSDEEYFIEKSGGLRKTPTGELLILSKRELDSIFSMLCDYSVFSFQNEIKEGFITLKSGHRAGICGTAVTDGTGIKTIKDISSINLRIAKQVPGCADRIISLLRNDFCGMIIAGPPGSGKTTVLRDTVRQLCSGVLGKYIRTSIIDERCEIAPIFSGESGFDMGFSCDILSGYPKHIGIQQAVKNLSPQLCVCDEICSSQEVQAISEGMNSGVVFIVSVHASNLAELCARPVIKNLVDTGAFKRIVMLGSRAKAGSVTAVYNVCDIGKRGDK